MNSPKVQLEKFEKAMKESNIAMSSVLPHGSYLVNLGSPDSELQKKSRSCFLEELLRCESLGVSKHNIHPGSNKVPSLLVTPTDRRCH